MLSTMKSRRGENTRTDRKTIEDKYSIKNLIFTPSLPTYEIPVDLEGHKVFLCVDCGDKFVCESSYNFHVNRRSVKITYTCRSCLKTMVYMNRCNLLSHIRSHVFKTATINLMDLKVESLPLNEMVFGLYHYDEPLTLQQLLRNDETVKKQKIMENPPITSQVQEAEKNNCGKAIASKQTRKRVRLFKCTECTKKIPRKPDETVASSRIRHFNVPDTSDHVCVLCHYKLPNSCALKAHLRLHNITTQCSVCPECGEFLYVNKKHSCPGLKQIRLFTFISCPTPNCAPVQLPQYRQHFLENHMKPVYKCSLCDTACFKEAAVQAHISSKHYSTVTGANPDTVKVSMYYQCSLCPGRLVLKQYLNSHIETHKGLIKVLFPCKKCDFVGTVISEFIAHTEVCTGVNEDKTDFNNTLSIVDVPKKKQKRKSKNSNKEKLTKTSSNNLTDSSKTSTVTNKTIKCPLCHERLKTDWMKIKIHFRKHHTRHVCIDPKLELYRVDLRKKTNLLPPELKRKICYSSEKSKAKRRPKNNNSFNSKKKNVVVSPAPANVQRPGGMFSCLKCGDSSSLDAESFKKHVLTHRDPTTAYQCMECGCCFVVKPSFSTHLFVAHSIRDADRYIETNDCYNPDAFKVKIEEEEPLKPNQCNICREEFSCKEDYDKHFRVHGMAFLMKRRGKQ